MKQLSLVCLLLAAPTVLLAEPPPTAPFQEINWAPSLKVPPAEGVELGSLHVRFEVTTLRDIQAATALGVIQHSGDGGESMCWLCYTVPHLRSSERIWFISHAEMGGEHQAVTAISAIKTESVGAVPGCPVLPGRSGLRVIGKDLWLGSRMDVFQKTLGKPSYREGNADSYDFETKLPGKCEGGVDRLNWLQTKSAGGTALEIYAGQVSSC